MTTLLNLQYLIDNSELFSRIRQLPQALWLDSQGAGRYELIMAAPSSFCHWSGGCSHWSGEPLAAAISGLDGFAAAHALQRSRQLPFTVVEGSPFQGGIAGYWGYESSTRGPAAAAALPEAAWGWYDWFIVTDHALKTCRLAFLDRCNPRTREAVMRCLDEPVPHEEPFHLLSPFQPETTRQDYARHIGQLHDYILAGDCYQVNYTQAFSAPFRGSPWTAYRALRQSSRSPYAACLCLPFADILCLSPEQFLEIREGVVTSKPIKGTRPRFPDDAVRDAAEAAALLASSKDRAENVMITDLLRNDISHHAETGSVVVEKLCALESFSLVHHLVSTIKARLKKESHPIDLFRDAFPGGSITGAPKRRAMEIIDELEQTPRSVYCGSIGYLSADGALETNIAIRTLLCQDGKVRAWAGGGITADSRWEDEYQECLSKIGGIIRTLEAL